MGKVTLQLLANKAGLGQIHFQFNVAKNGSHREFEVGYVFPKGQQTLFCKRQPGTSEEEFYTCNEFRNLK